MNAPARPNGRELVLTRVIPAAREKLFRAWTEPALLKPRFIPPPFVPTLAALASQP